MAGLSIKVTEPAGKAGDCGGARMVVEWDVGNKSGFVVQKVRFDMDDFHCTNAGLAPEPRHYEYWEAWEVVAGTVHPGFRDVSFPAGSHDHDTFFFADGGPGTKGTRRITAKVKFLEGAKLSKTRFVPRSVPSAGVLPATERKPDGWTDAGAEDHTLRVKWSCCRGHEQAPSVTGTPAPAAQPQPAGGGGGGGEKPGGKPPKSMKNAAERALWTLPAWSAIGAENAAGRSGLRRRLNAFARMPLPEIREGIRLYIQDAAELPGGYGVAEMSRVFVLNRFLFRVPPAMPRRQARFVGGWHVPHTEREVDMLWPFAETRSGALRLVGSFSAYLGSPYDGLAEFDWFRRRFPPRWHQRAAEG